MNPFPLVDPIPLPAPVWLFKVLHVATLSLHFVAVHMLLGGLVMGTLWNFLGRRSPDSVFARASAAIAHRLPIVTTYVINLGVPPLLFAQVLYGRALYTSSVLIGFYWLSVVFLVIAGYYLLYQMAKRAEAGRAWWWIGLGSLLLFAYVARIYSTNMTLMIRPEVWLEMYRTNPHGTTMPTGDPTVLPRWLFMMLGSLGIGAGWLILLATGPTIRDDVRTFMQRWGGAAAAAFVALQAFAGYWVFQAQPAVVQSALAAEPLYRYSLLGWAAASTLLFAAGAAAAAGAGGRSRLLPAAAALAGVLSAAAATIVRDGVRDVTLLSKGFDVWDQPVAPNWSVVVLFLVLFAAGLAAIGWMIKVAASAKGAKESHA